VSVVTIGSGEWFDRGEESVTQSSYCRYHRALWASHPASLPLETNTKR